MVGHQLSVLVLTEDSGNPAHAVVSAIATKVLFLIDPGLDDSRLKFRRAPEPARAGMAFNCYKSRKPRDNGKKVELAQAIADHLLGGDGLAAVFVHIDGDRRWSERDVEHLCDNVRVFEEEILRRVRALLQQRGQSEKIEHLALLVPFWSIESWLFQNIDEALRICAEMRPRYDGAISHFERWRDHPHQLDEHERPKDTVSFGSKYNQRLAENNFPAKRLRQLGLSFAHTIQRVEHSGLRALVASISRDVTSKIRE